MRMALTVRALEITQGSDMYHYPGEYVTDFCITRHQGIFHLFHIRGERWTWPLGYREIDLGHAVSTDLRLWTPQAPVIPVGPSGAWDELGVWAPDVVERDGVYYLFYTGSDAAYNQRIGVATSTDLYHWTKHPANPVVAPGPWSDRARGQQVAGRDGMVFADIRLGRYLLYYTATLADGRPCIALASSHDLIHWDDLGPTYVEDDPSYNRCESAYVVEHAGRYYLFYSAKGGPQSKGHSPDSFAHFDIVYLVSDDPTGGWIKPDNHELLTQWTCAGEHPTFDGTTYMLYVVQEEVEGIWGASVLSDPKEVTWRADGRVKVKEHLPANVARRTLYSQQTGLAGWVARPDAWRVNQEGDWQPPVGKTDAVLVNPLWGRDAAVEVEIRGEAGALGSLLIRCNPSGASGYRFTLDFARGVLALFLCLYERPDQLLQERAVKLTPGEWHKLKVVAQGDFFDAYLDDELVLVRSLHSFDEGCCGLHGQGEVSFRNLHACEYIGPEKLLDTAWTRRVEPRYLFPISDD